MRGKVANDWAMVGNDRITPAYAGKRGVHQKCIERRKDHPCVCGEKTRRFHRLHFRHQSPLRMRGKDTDNASDKADDRITPAYAGKRPSYMNG